MCVNVYMYIYIYVYVCIHGYMNPNPNPSRPTTPHLDPQLLTPKPQALTQELQERVRRDANSLDTVSETCARQKISLAWLRCLAHLRRDKSNNRKFASTQDGPGVYVCMYVCMFVCMYVLCTKNIMMLVCMYYMPKTYLRLKKRLFEEWK